MSLFRAEDEALMDMYNIGEDAAIPAEMKSVEYSARD